LIEEENALPQYIIHLKPEKENVYFGEDDKLF
jgi:hypothetical protein